MRVEIYKYVDYACSWISSSSVHTDVAALLFMQACMTGVPAKVKNNSNTFFPLEEYVFKEPFTYLGIIIIMFGVAFVRV